MGKRWKKRIQFVQFLAVALFWNSMAAVVGQLKGEGETPAVGPLVLDFQDTF
jgi:hypothetical protein